MKSLPQLLRLLRWNILALAICLAAAGAAAHFMWQAGQRKAAAAQQAEAQADRLRADIQRLRNEEQEVRNKIQQYASIAARGAFGAEHRLDWVDLIKSIRQTHRLLDIQYEIQPQAPLPPSLFPNAAASGHVFKASTMRVTLPMVHEADLVHFIADLRAKAPAFVRVDECRINRQSPTTEQRAQLLAECTLDWITMPPQDAGAHP